MKKILLSVFLVSLSLSLFPQEKNALIINEHDDMYDMLSVIQIWEDKSGKAELNTIDEAAFEKVDLKHGDSLFLSFSSSSYWIRFKLRNLTHERKFILALNHPVMDEAVLYQPGLPPPPPEASNRNENPAWLFEHKGSVLKKSGYKVPFSFRDIPNRNIAFYIDDIGPDQYYYLKVSSRDRIDIPLVLWKPEAFFTADHKNQFVLGILYGVIVFLIANNLFLFLRMKEKTYFYLSGFLFCIMLFFSTQNGVNTYDFIFHSSLSFITLNTPLIIGISLISYLPFFRHFTKMKKYFPVINRTVRGMEWVVIGFLPLSQFIPFRMAVVTGVSITLVYTLLVTYLSLFMTLKRNREARQFTIAWSIFVSGLFFYILRCFGIIPISAFSSQVLELGTAFAGVIFSIGLAGQIDFLIKQTEKQREFLRTTNQVLEKKVNQRTQELKEKNENLSNKTDEILSSIRYAQKIQKAIMVNPEIIRQDCPDFFVFWQPRDIVGGDFYWYKRLSNNSFYLAVVDCTGHGVPGALMTIAASSTLNSMLSCDSSDYLPHKILPKLHDEINSALHQNTDKTESDDGMDIGLCLYLHDQKKVHFAGARISLFFRDEAEINEIKGCKKSLGYSLSGKCPEFIGHEIKVSEKSVFYMTSDGFLHQNGEDYKYPYGRDKFRKMLGNIQGGPDFRYQEMQINRALKEFMGNQEQRDDIIVLGFKPPVMPQKES